MDEGLKTDNFDAAFMAALIREKLPEFYADPCRMDAARQYALSFYLRAVYRSLSSAIPGITAAMSQINCCNMQSTLFQTSSTVINSHFCW